MATFTIVGKYEGGETFVGWYEGKTAQEAVLSVFKNHTEFAEGYPAEIVAVFEGKHTDILSSFHQRTHSYRLGNY